jgi:hypothetical protein
MTENGRQTKSNHLGSNMQDLYLHPSLAQENSIYFFWGVMLWRNRLHPYLG